jgi:hypothetical protein
MHLDMTNKINHDWAAVVTEQMAVFLKNPATAIYRGPHLKDTAVQFITEQFGPQFGQLLERRLRDSRRRRATTKPTP